MAASVVPVTHAIFDLDGLLINSEILYEAADKAVLQSYGKEYSLELEWELKGRPPKSCAQIIVDHYKLDMTPEEYLALVHEEQKKLFPKCETLPGMMKIVHHLRRSNIPMAIATSSDRESVALKTSHLKGLMSHFDFDHVVSASDDDVPRGKPSPDIFLVAKTKFSEEAVSSEKCLVFEDAVAGVQAANAAAMRSVFIPDQRMPSDVRKRVKADMILASGHDFQPELFGMPPFSYKPVTHVIFDVDGLLLDTDPIFQEAASAILSKHGKSLTWEQRVKLMGKTRKDIIAGMIDMLELPLSHDELNDELTRFVNPKYPSVKLFPGVKRLIKHLHSHKIPIAIATSSSQETLTEKTKNHGQVFKLFDHAITANHPGLRKGKPDPQVFVLCADQFSDKPSPSQCLVLEDAPNGVEAAVSAGMQCVMVPHQSLTAQFMNKATQVVHSLVDFRPEDFGLPPF